MSRRRSTDPSKAIGITLPASLLARIDDKLSYFDSRSAWIAKSCTDRLNESFDIEDYTPAFVLNQLIKKLEDDPSMTIVVINLKESLALYESLKNYKS